MDYEGFKRGVFDISGINLDYYKERQMKRRINSLMRRNSFSEYKSYLKSLMSEKKLYDEFINYLTINVSEFRRNPEQWDILQNEILPEILKKNTSLRVWSCACSSGEEPYTMVMILNKYLTLEHIKIIATDIDTAAIERARKGIYLPNSIDALPENNVRRYFCKDKDKYIISDEIKKCVDFKRLDLLYDKYPENCDIIICRNVLIYFTQQAKEMIYEKTYNSLKTGGILFVGGTEQIIMPHRYGLKPLKTFFYVKP